MLHLGFSLGSPGWGSRWPYAQSQHLPAPGPAACVGCSSGRKQLAEASGWRGCHALGLGLPQSALQQLPPSPQAPYEAIPGHFSILVFFIYMLPEHIFIPSRASVFNQNDS